MEYNRTKSNKITKTNAESSRANVKRQRDREAKRQRIEAVQPTGFDVCSSLDQTSQEDDASPLQSQLMLLQPPTDSQTSELEEGASAEGMSSPLLHGLSPLLGANTLDALDGWSLGSNMYFSDTGSGGGFLESQGSTVKDECGPAVPLLDVCSLRSGKHLSKQVKAKAVSPILSQSRSQVVKKVAPASSQDLSEVESVSVLDDVKESSVSQSPLGVSDDMLSHDGGDEEEDVVLEYVPTKEPNRKSRKKIDQVIKVKQDSSGVTNALALCQDAEIDAPALSQGSSGADLFSGSENQNLVSSSHSSVEVDDIPSAAQVKTTARSSRRLQKNKEVETFTIQDKYSEKKNDKSTGKTSRNTDKSKWENDMSEEKRSEKVSDKSRPNTNTSPETNSETKGKKSVAKTSRNVDKLKSDGQSSVGKVSLDDERSKSSEQSHIENFIQNIDDSKPRRRLSGKRAGKLARCQKNGQSDGRSVMDSLSSALVEDTENGADSENNLKDKKKDGLEGKAKSCSTSKKSPAKKTKHGVKCERGRIREETELAVGVDLQKPNVKSSGKKLMENAPVEGGRTRSPNLFEYESDSVITPSPLVTHARKNPSSTDLVRRKGSDQTEQEKTFSAEKTRSKPEPNSTDISQRKSSHPSMSSKFTLTDSGIVATPASFALASRPGLASKLKTSTPLDQYRSMVGLDKPRRGVKRQKRSRDSGNDSDFVLESNLSMPSPVWPVPPVRSQGKGQGRLRGSEATGKMKKARRENIGEDDTKLFAEAKPREVSAGKSATKERKVTQGNENLPRNEISVKSRDAEETARTGTRVTGVADAKKEGPRKKKSGHRDVDLNEAKARQSSIEQLVHELDEIDQNYSLIIDD